MLSLVIWVAIDIVLWGFMTKYLNSVTAAGFDFVPVLLGAVLMWDFFTRVMFGVTMAFFEDVWSRNFLNVFGSPISITEYLAGLVASSIITSTLGLLVMLALATALFGLSFLSYGGMLVPFLMVLFLFGIALGIVGVFVRLAVRAVRRMVRLADSGDSVAVRRRLLSDFHDAGLDPVARAFCCRRSMSLKGCARLLRAVRSRVRRSRIGGMLAVFYVLSASLVFTRIYRKAVRTGLIARYSAESVT